MVFCRGNEAFALLGVETLAQIADPKASVALARQAVFSPSKKVRKAAAEKLKSRDKHSYVPVLLSAMKTSIQSRAELYVSPMGRLTYRHALYREGRNDRYLAVLDTSYLRNWSYAVDPNVATSVVERTAAIVPEGAELPPDRQFTQRTARFSVEQLSPFEQWLQARRDAEAKAEIIQTAVNRQNLISEAFNRHICSVLSMATGAIVAPTAEKWWQWWNDYNEAYLSGYKSLKTAYNREKRDIVVGGTVQQNVDVTYNVKYEYFRPQSCLAAGTPVWTELGPTAVEAVRVGDRVLSQDIETGQLAYKPVLQTTERAPGELIDLQIDGEQITCTGGHPFWICGDGWVKARLMVPGTRLHGVAGTTPVGTVQPASKGKAYNLVVADFNTYFVGKTKILSHDITIHKPTTMLVPGLAEP